ncbi:interferon-induced protein with tetratricopeptide repeats 5-like [Myripristis murdjan]|uniref:interferon-induced protein with tetratricopeptide repeats 5-like n=1 Tax=Myripristis murdjan TaxID=586833 RepID=UPI0011761742|nr:interferon-induced protein with tetratricopeptide repeats 5-like [Myripristis murdjan]
MSEADRALRSRLLKLESRFMWDLRKEHMDLEDLSTRLQEQIDEGPGRRDTVDHSYSFLAYVRYLQDRPEEAVLLLNQSEERTRERFGEESERWLIVTYGDLAWLSYHTGDYTLCEAYCGRVEDILLRNPTSSPSVLHPEVYGEKAWTFLKFSIRYYPRAIQCFRKAMELQPDNSEWNSGYAIALYRLRQRDEETSEEAEDSPVIRQLRRALELSPDDGMLLMLLALRLHFYQQHEEAEALVERALEVDPDHPHITRYVAKYLRVQGEVERSIDLLQRVLENNGKSAFIHHQLALCYRKKKIALYDRMPFFNQEMKYWRRLMIQHLEEAVRLRPCFVYAMTDLALMYAENKDLNRAEELFQRALMMSSERDKYIRQFVHLRYAQFNHYHTKQEAKAITHYTKGLLTAVNTVDGRKCAEKLKQIAERHLSGDGNDGEALGVLGLVYRAEGELTEAAGYYERALTCDLNNQQHREALSQLRMELTQQAHIP